jgi:hypothetical protein
MLFNTNKEQKKGNTVRFPIFYNQQVGHGGGSPPTGPPPLPPLASLVAVGAFTSSSSKSSLHPVKQSPTDSNMANSNFLFMIN